MSVLAYSPMLASSGPLRGSWDEYWVEPKWDGWRAVAAVGDRVLIVRTRTGRDITNSPPNQGASTPTTRGVGTR